MRDWIKAQWAQFAHETLLDNSAVAWLSGALAFVLTIALFLLLRGALRAQRRRFADREPPLAIALLTHLSEHTSRIVLWIAALYVAEQLLTLPKRVDRLFSIAFVLGFWLQMGRWGTAAMRFVLRRHQMLTGDPRLSGSMDVVLFMLGFVIWSIIALLALENLGIDVAPLIAGLGIGGIAIALAVQTVLGDLLASLAIALDKPFVIGDALRVDTFEGAVEHIGIKSTRLRSITGEQIVISNADLLKSRVRNLGRASERRWLFTLLLAYETPADRLEQVPELVKQAVASYEGTRFLYCVLKELGESGPLFEVIFFVDNRPGREIPYALDQINRRILQSFARAGIRFAHPARSLWLHRDSQLSATASVSATDRS
jgi:small-conductance mechanosensitive channel